MAAMALIHLSHTQFAVVAVATVRAAEALWAAQLEQRIPAGLFGAVLFEELGQTETFLNLDDILRHFVTSCFLGGYEISKRPSQ